MGEGSSLFVADADSGHGLGNLFVLGKLGLSGSAECSKLTALLLGLELEPLAAWAQRR